MFRKTYHLPTAVTFENMGLRRSSGTFWLAKRSKVKVKVKVKDKDKDKDKGNQVLNVPLIVYLFLHL